MSLAKSSLVVITPAVPATPAQAYSRTCPAPPPSSVDAPTYPAEGSGGLPSGCYEVPVYGLLPTVGQFGNLNGGYAYGIVGYNVVCS